MRTLPTRTACAMDGGAGRQGLCGGVRPQRALRPQHYDEWLPGPHIAHEHRPSAAPQRANPRPPTRRAARCRSAHGLRHPGRPHSRPGRPFAPAVRCAARRPRRHLRGQLPRVPGGAARHRVGGRRVRARQLQAARQGTGLRAGRQRRACAAGVAGAHGRRAGGGRAEHAGAGQRCLRGRPAPRAHARARPRARRRGIALLHLRHHGPPQGRDADAPQPAGHDGLLLHRRGRRAARRRHGLRRAHVARRGPVQLRPGLARRTPRGARFGRLRARRAGGTGGQRGPAHPVCRAHHGAPPGGPCARHRRRRVGLQNHRLWRRPHVCRRLAQCPGRDGPPLCAGFTARAKAP